MTTIVRSPFRSHVTRSPLYPPPLLNTPAITTPRTGKETTQRKGERRSLADSKSLVCHLARLGF